MKFFSKWKRSEKFRYDLSFFVAVVVVVGVVLGGIASIDPQIPFLQRAVSTQSTFFLNIIGVEAHSFNDWVEVPTATLQDGKVREIRITLAKLSMDSKMSGSRLIAWHDFLTLSQHETLMEYVGELRRQGTETEYSPATIVTPGITIKVVPGCTGWLGTAAITALILAYPGSRKRHKLYGLFYAWAAMYVVNIVRMVSTTALTNWWGHGVFEFLHIFLWREAMVAFALVIWVLWLRHYGR